MANKALVTGAHGFIGRHAARRLAEAGYVVTGLGHGSWDKTERSRYGLTFWHAADVTLESLVTYADEPDIILHCAGSGSVAFSMSHPYQDFTRTVAGTSAVLEYVRLHSPSSALVYPSSAGVYGKAERLPIREEDPKHPISPYGEHKLMAERLCQSYATSFGVRVAILRFFSVYGEGLQKQLLWDASRKIVQNDTAFFGTGDETRDWLHVSDAATLLLIAADHACSACPIANGASGNGTTTREILSSLFKQLGRTDEPEFSGAHRSGDPSHYLADTFMAGSWGWKPEVSLESGLSRYVAWFKSTLDD